MTITFAIASGHARCITPAKVRLVDGEHDVFGDGTVVCLPSHGHTPGISRSSCVSGSGEIVLAADARYFCQPCVNGDYPAMRPTAMRCWPRSTDAKGAGEIRFRVGKWQELHQNDSRYALGRIDPAICIS